MHTYVISTAERWRIYFYLVFASILIVKGLDLILKFYFDSLPPGIHLPSAFAVYGLVYLSFDRWLWKIKLFSMLGINEVPIIAGKWEGKLRSSCEKFEVAYPVVVKIHQTWNKISIHLDGSSRESHSTMAMFEIKSPSHSRLEWTFISRSKPGATSPDMFCGVTRLSLEIDGNKMASSAIEGDYYTETGRDTYGSIKLSRVS